MRAQDALVFSTLDPKLKWRHSRSTKFAVIAGECGSAGGGAFLDLCMGNLIRSVTESCDVNFILEHED
jgi:hypothetical protein